MKKYGIEIIGYGTHRRYCIKEILHSGTNPIDGKAYKTEDGARAAAEHLGLTVEGVGDLWELLALA